MARRAPAKKGVGLWSGLVEIQGAAFFPSFPPFLWASEPSGAGTRSPFFLFFFFFLSAGQAPRIIVAAARGQTRRMGFFFSSFSFFFPYRSNSRPTWTKKLCKRSLEDIGGKSLSFFFLFDASGTGKDVQEKKPFSFFFGWERKFFFFPFSLFLFLSPFPPASAWLQNCMDVLVLISIFPPVFFFLSSILSFSSFCRANRGLRSALFHAKSGSLRVPPFFSFFFFFSSLFPFLFFEACSRRR